MSEGSSHPTPVSSDSSQDRESPSFILAAFRSQAKEAGLSDRAADFTAGALRDSSCVTYNSKLECFARWCEVRHCCPTSAFLGQLADFFISLFDKGLSVSTLCLYRSAFASCHSVFQDGSSFPSSLSLSRLFRSFFLKRPPVKSLLPAWSLPAVLHALSLEPFEPMYRASFHHLTLKTVFLVAIASGHRVSTFHALTIDPGHFRWEPRGVRLVPRADFIAKNLSSSSPQVEFFLPSMSSFSSVPEDKVSCPVRALRLVPRQD